MDRRSNSRRSGCGHRRFWVYAITTAEDMPTLLMLALIAIPVGLAVLLTAVIRDRIINKKKENFLEVDN